MTIQYGVLLTRSWLGTGTQMWQSISGEMKTIQPMNGHHVSIFLLKMHQKHIEGLLMSSRLQNELRYSVPLAMFVRIGLVKTLIL
jgi:hypothetical protein